MNFFYPAKRTPPGPSVVDTPLWTPALKTQYSLPLSSPSTDTSTTDPRILSASQAARWMLDMVQDGMHYPGGTITTMMPEPLGGHAVVAQEDPWAEMKDFVERSYVPVREVLRRERQKG